VWYSENIANYNVPSIINEQNVFSTFLRKAKTIYPYLVERSLIKNQSFYVSVASATSLSNIKNSSIDFVFTDPPFGSNINYSEMNFIWESWLGFFTQTENEAIINKYQNKTIREYEELLTKSFKEIYRILKDDAWACIIFHNSSEKVWNALKQAITNSGLKIVNIQLFNKKHGTFKQFVSDNAVGYDLIIHCNKKNVAMASEKNGSSVEQYFNEIKPNISRYRVEYLHVNREAEIDYRKMYSEWLSVNIKQMTNIISFEHFSRIIKNIMGSV
jgi:adenine-specific DNA methylase